MILQPFPILCYNTTTLPVTYTLPEDQNRLAALQSRCWNRSSRRIRTFIGSVHPYPSET
ncbi:hypothetical protein HanXRQr2_Chr07g0286241 [Helianthus annuus]|uniref:Uncharacterized protein n=1 Tax=Helianthus annuus TaxID=4232 RepID=A0A251RYV6_HELAN|nr:hypothetical protein HanXRQr2_Chr07g0286241 [Helianthus annuus]KAJ0556002.1 hypothetical protein HanIR_Chr07g0308711 [Helianthus annuus]KAJ0904035.1 hypothetical protein HanPSC8_Chr07g0277151 [Helianthus annuus]